MANLSSCGDAVAVIEPWVAPEHRGTETSRMLFEGFANAFDDEVGYAVDHGWRSRVDPRNDEWFGEDYEHSSDEGVSQTQDVTFVALSGTGLLAYSIWEGDEEEPSGRLLRDADGRVRRRPRWEGTPVARRGLGYRLLDS